MVKALIRKDTVRKLRNWKKSDYARNDLACPTVADWSRGASPPKNSKPKTASSPANWREMRIGKRRGSKLPFRVFPEPDLSSNCLSGQDESYDILAC